ncbi:MAG: hypothetical protein JNM17_15360 [Archangium sp.]|nr:hypothetical protein [Archangium sp.]
MFAWRVLARPAGSAATVVAASATAVLEPDAVGDWVIEVKAFAAGQQSLPVVAVVHVLRAPSLDAGIDAGVRDAGFSDAGFDAGAPDAGTPDAGAPDAGIPDAGRPDAGVDAGVRDAGAIDAGPIAPSLDAGAIYLAGTLQEGACYRDALADLFNPNVASTGFDCYFANDTAVVRPTDGALLYFNTFEWLLREYRCDECAVTSAATPYPVDPLANDRVIPTQCPTSDRMTGFAVTADGEVLHRCSMTSGIFRLSNGAVAHNAGSDTVLAFGATGWALTRTRVINWKLPSTGLITGLPASMTLLAARWSPPDGFWLALRSNGVDELWRIDLAGVATKSGTFGASPPNTTASVGGSLDSAGRLFQAVNDTSAAFRDVVLMKEIGQPTVVVYTEATNPLVKIHISSLVTGP